MYNSSTIMRRNRQLDTLRNFRSETAALDRATQSARSLPYGVPVFGENDQVIADNIERNNGQSVHPVRAKAGGATLWVMHLTGMGTEELDPSVSRQEQVGTRALSLATLSVTALAAVVVRTKTGL